jgi:hypothetical protein
MSEMPVRKRVQQIAAMIAWPRKEDDSSEWPEGTVTDDEIADPQVIPYLLYADAGAALAWLVDTFRFAVRVRDVRADGTVRHGELQLDRGGVIMLGSAGSGFRGPGALGGQHSWSGSRSPICAIIATMGWRLSLRHLRL